VPLVYPERSRNIRRSSYGARLFVPLRSVHQNLLPRKRSRRERPRSRHKLLGRAVARLRTTAEVERSRGLRAAVFGRCGLDFRKEFVCGWDNGGVGTRLGP
jgi:hypothetical protein